MPLRPGEPFIHDGNAHLYVGHPTGQGRGLVPRDWQKVPCGSIPGVPEAAIPKIPRSEWSDRIKELENAKALLSDVRMTGANGGMIPSRDQNGRGYCWAHSTTSAALLSRAKNNQPYADLSAYAIACIIKGYADEGGWCGESMQFLRERGVPSSQFWPQRSVSRSNDNPQTWADAAKYKMTSWLDIQEGDFDMQFTLLLMGNPHALDENWWAHSICATDPVDGASSRPFCRGESGKLMDLAEFDDAWGMNTGGGYGIRIWNSWGEDYGLNGMAVLSESKSTNNGATCLFVMEESD